MMTPFLKQFAADLIKAHGPMLADVHIVVPGKRAALFLKKHLYDLHQGPVLSPEIMTLPEWFQKIGQQKNITSFESTLLLYQCYIQTVKDPEDFQTFMKWAGHAMNDFNDVNQYLVDHALLFQNIKDIKAIDSWSLHQEPLSEVQEKFLQFWHELGDLYRAFEIEAQNQKKWNYAQLTRQLAEKKLALHSDATHTYFVGLSRLTPAEEKVIEHFKKAYTEVQIIWDADPYYVNNPSHEAGQYFQQKIKKGESVAMQDCMQQGVRKVSIWKSNTALGGAAILAKRLSELNAKEREETVVVITDNNSLLPIITHLDTELPINVAIGWPLKLSGVYQLFLSYIHFCIKTQRQSRIYHKDLLQWIEQPVLRKITDPWRNDVLKTLIDKKRAYFTSEELWSWMKEKSSATLFENFLPFIAINDQDSKSIVSKMNHLCALILDDDSLDDITRECALQWQEKWEKLEPAHDQYKFLQTTEALEILIQHVISKESIALEGEPLEGLQIIGMIETRALDFKKVIFSHATEESMPGQSQMQTLIPFELRKAFEMPMPGDREASYAYNFYRLIQRAEEIEFYYPTTTSDFRSVERSRYIQQLEWEWPLYHSSVQFNTQTISLPGSQDLDFEEIITADAFSKKQLMGQFKNGLSPSAINRYLSCPLDYYYRYVLGIGEINELEEQVDSAGMGTIVHAVLEKWHEPLLNTALTLQNIQQWRSELDAALLKEFQYNDDNVVVEGYNLLAMEAAKKMIERVLNYDEELIQSGNPPTIIFTEKQMSRPLTLDDGTEVLIKGTLDRVHMSGGICHILDYKTGKVEGSDLSIGEIEIANILNGKKAKLTQILLYAWMAYKEGLSSLDKLQVGLFPLGTVEGKPHWLKNADQLLHPDFMKDWEEGIRQLIMSMLERPEFAHHEESQYCQFCRGAGH